MIKVSSTVWPWDHGKLTVGQVVQHAKNLKLNEVCLRAPVYFSPYKPDFHIELARQLRLNSIGVSLWPVVSLTDPARMARSIKAEYEVYEPDRLVLDAERHWVLDYIQNLPLFLSELGSMPCPVGLGSYRRASLHNNMNWQTWYKAKAGAKYIIKFVAHQLYPIGWKGVQNWVSQTKLDVASHETELLKAGRPDMPWLPWLPSFIGGGFEGLPVPWVPTADELQAQVELLKTLLGERLAGVNFWGLDKNLVDLPDVYHYVTNLEGENAEHIPSTEERIANIEKWARTLGFPG